MTERLPFRLAPLLALLLVVSAACVRRPSGVASDDEFAPVVADMELAEAYMQTQNITGNRDELRLALIAGVLEKHGMSRQDYDRTMDWYSRNVDAYSKLDAKVSAELSARRRDMGRKNRKRGREVAVSEGSDLWQYKPTAMISSLSGSRMLPFSLPAAEIQPGMSVTWKMKLRTPAEANILLGIEYEDGVISFLSRKISGDRRPEISIQTDTARRASRIFGNLSVNRVQDLPLWLDSISLAGQPLDSTQYFRIHSQRTVRPPMRRKPVTKAPADTVAQAKEKADNTPVPANTNPHKPSLKIRRAR